MDEVKPANAAAIGPGYGRGVLTRHAECRIRQRGFREADIGVLLQFGSRMSDGTVMLTDRDVRREVTRLRQWIACLDRLRGITAVVHGNDVVTVFKGSPTPRRRRLSRED